MNDNHNKQDERLSVDVPLQDKSVSRDQIHLSEPASTVNLRVSFTATVGADQGGLVPEDSDGQLVRTILVKPRSKGSLDAPSDDVYSEQRLLQRVPLQDKSVSRDQLQIGEPASTVNQRVSFTATDGGDQAGPVPKDSDGQLVRTILMKPRSKDSLDAPSDAVLNEQRLLPRYSVNAMRIPSPNTLKDSSLSLPTTVEASPLFFCQWIVLYPWPSFGLVAFLHLVPVLAFCGLLATGHDLFPINFRHQPLDLRDDVDYLHGLAWFHRFSTVRSLKYLAHNWTTMVTPERSRVADVIEFYFEDVVGGNVFTTENLKLIQQVENKFFYNEEFQRSFCLLDGGECVKPISVTRYFDGSLKNVCTQFDDPQFANSVSVLNAANTNHDTKLFFHYHMGKHAVISKYSATSKITRLSMSIGKPLKGYDSTKDREKEQNKKIVTFLKKHFQPLAVSYHNEGVGNMAFYYNSPLLFLAGIITQAKVDLWLAFGSLLFVSVVMRVYTCSCWVTFWSLFGMATSFISALLVYYYVFDLHFLGEWHLLSAFVFVGVGVDNVFVCHDAWMDAGRHHHATLAHRLSASCREVASPVFMTTLIITTAYSAKAASPLLTIYSFGVFIAPLTLINSLSVAFLFPVVIVTYHVTWKKLECGEHRVNLKNDSASGLLRQAQLERKEHALANVFGGPYLRCIVHPTARWLILLISVCLIGNSSYIIWRSFRVNRKQLTYFKEDTNFGQFEQKHDMAFSDSLDSDHTSKIYLVWGLLDQDLSSCHATDHLCIGRTVLDNQFEINSKAAQLALLGVCRHLKNLLAADITRLHIRKHFYTRQPELKCFIDDVNKLLQKEQNRLILDAGTGNASRVYPVGTNLSIPVGREEAELIVKNNPKFFPQSMPTGYDRYFEVVVWFWAISMEHSCEYSDLLGIVHNKDYAEHHVHCAYFHQRLAFVAIAINTTLHPSTVRYRPGEEVRAQYEQLMTSFDMPAGTKKGFHLALGADIVSDFNRNMWHWFKVQKYIQLWALTGTFVGLGVSLPICIAATGNIILGVFATFNILFILVTVVAISPLAGLKIGVFESLNLMLIVGLSVNYAVMMTVGYRRSVAPGRFHRIHDTLRKVGVSVVYGGLTSIGASFFLMFARLNVVAEFGVFTFSTILCSTLYSLVLFSTLLGCVGPQEEVGDVRAICRYVWRCLMCRSKV